MPLCYLQITVNGMGAVVLPSINIPIDSTEYVCPSKQERAWDMSSVLAFLSELLTGFKYSWGGGGSRSLQSCIQHPTNVRMQLQFTVLYVPFLMATKWFFSYPSHSLPLPPTCTDDRRLVQPSATCTAFDSFQTDASLGQCTTTPTCDVLTPVTPPWSTTSALPSFHAVQFLACNLYTWMGSSQHNSTLP